MAAPIITGVVIRDKLFLRWVGETLEFRWLLNKDPEWAEVKHGTTEKAAEELFLEMMSERKGLLEDLLRSLACGAVTGNDFLSLQEILSWVDVNCGDYDGTTPLHMAAICGNTNMVKFLLARGGALSERPVWRYPPVPRYQIQVPRNTDPSSNPDS